MYFACLCFSAQTSLWDHRLNPFMSKLRNYYLIFLSLFHPVLRKFNIKLMLISILELFFMWEGENSNHLCREEQNNLENLVITMKISPFSERNWTAKVHNWGIATR